MKHDFPDKNKSMKANNNNVLRRGALFSLFITSYISDLLVPELAD